MNTLAPVIDKLAILIPLLSSDKDSEVVATAQAIQRQLVKAGADWHDLAVAMLVTPVPAPRHEAAAFYDYLQACEWALRTNCGALPAHVLRFAEDMRGILYRYPPTPKQAAWLRGLVEKLGGRFDG